jgi:alpha-beta hydrolase superfamily lysophospholipase
MQPSRRSPVDVLVVLVAALLLVAGACGGDDSSEASPTTESAGASAEGASSGGQESDDADPRRFDRRGEHPVGTLDLELGGGSPAMVFYPAAGVPEGAQPFSYSGVEIFGEGLAELLPSAFRDDQVVPDAWVEVPASQDGPFPVVLYSHGFGGYYRFSALHNAHVASHGYVVVAVDHPERGLLASFGGGDSFDGVSDVDQLFEALSAVEELSGSEGSVLGGVADTERVAAEGHSAGGRASGAAADDERIAAWIGQAPAPPVRRDTLDDPAAATRDFDFAAWAAENDPPPVPAMIIAADGDVAIALDQVRSVFAWLAEPKRLVVLADAGHNAFTDICRPIQQEGGLASTVEALGLDPDEVPIVRLGEDGCTDQNPPAEEGWAVIDHLTVAFLDEVFGVDAEVATASLDAGWVQDEFPGLVAEIEFSRR